jgi:hypothetical protein
MTRTRINHWAGIMPLCLSGAAFLIAFAAGVIGWERGLKDEGVAAHLFQLLLALQIPVIALFLATADRSQPRAIGKWLALDLAAIAFAFAPVALLHL